MVNTTYNSTRDLNFKLQQLKGKTKLNVYPGISNHYEEMSFRTLSGSLQFEEYPFSKDALGIGKISCEVFLLLELLQTRRQVKNKNAN